MEKFKEWLGTAGIRSVGYLGVAVLCKIFLGSWFLAGVFAGVFFADNWVTIKGLIFKQADNLADKVFKS